MDTTGDAGLAAARLRGFFSGAATPSDASPGGSAAAVSGPVTKEMKLITESGKPVSKGDRVRVVEE